uniref:Putative conserved secreted protein n=1 Tax=Ixodes ricinus TaxID=34613 RepID=A0A6B0V4U7_IXORI
MARLLPLLFVHIALCGQLTDAEVLTYNTAYKYLEKALKRFVQYYNLDPMALPDVNQTFEKTIIFMTVQGEAILTNGSLAGLSTIHRTEYFHFGANRKGIEVHADFGAGPLHIHYAGNLTLIGITYEVDVNITIKNIRVVLQVFENLKKGLVVKDFRIKTMEGLTVKLHNRGIVGYIFNAIAKGATYIFKNLIRDRVDSALRAEVRNKVQELNDFVLRNGTLPGTSNKTLEE